MIDGQENRNTYVKGEREKILSRMDAVHSMTMFCPVNFDSLDCLKYCFGIICPQYKTDGDKWIDVPCADALKAFLVAVNSLGMDNSYPIDVISGVLKTFSRLKYIDFEFIDDKDLMKSFDYKTWSTDKTIYRKIYRIKKLEFNLSDMFSQKIIDIYNKVLMMNEIIPNSYLDRKFEIDYSYDEYISYMDMFIGNNSSSFNMIDKDICDYFISFPEVIIEHRPDIKVITNYSQL